MAEPRRARADGSLEVGRRVSVRFTDLTYDGAALARGRGITLAVPYAIPGEEGLVEVVETAPPRGRIVALRSKSPDATTPACPHFGRCGGCQWQHMTLEAQRRHKTAMVGQALRGAGVPASLVQPCRGGAGWAYRNLLWATVGRRGQEVIAGFYEWGLAAPSPPAPAPPRREAGLAAPSPPAPQLLNIEVCPVQHPANVRVLHVLRDAVRALSLPPYDRRRRGGLVRGIVGLTAFATGEALAVLSTSGPLPDRSAVVQAVLDRVPGLVGLLVANTPAPYARLLDGRMSLLWGRTYIEEEVLGVRLRLDPRLPLLPNPEGLPGLFDALLGAARLRGDEQVFDAYAESGLMPMALAGRVRRTVGVVPDQHALEAAWAAAARNGIANAVFYTRDPGQVLVKLHRRGERTDVLLAAPPGEGLGDRLLAALPEAGPGRLVYVGRSLPVTAADLIRLRQAGYQVRSAQPVDLFPHTSHVHTVVALERR